ncbi:MAG: ANTAR domain-containing protein [Butyribacter sp.]|nr:ANTAR domain-containing protein [bacterium]MDY3853418.1 ANTAR domain-containing protein [Butyribacter sp.]
MADIIVAFPKLDDAKNLRKLLIKNGYDVNMVCDSGSQVIDAVNRLDGGIVISGYRFSDMYYMEINDYLPKGFQMLLLASPAKLVDCDVRNLLSLAMPFKVQDLLNTLEMMMVQYNRWRKKQKNKPKVRSENDRRIISAAKELLIERNQMTEDEAHHYIQKLSMDSATNMVETAEMILELNGKEWDI